MTGAGLPKVVGFDPGLHRTGYGVLELGPARPRLVEAGVLRVPARRALEERLLLLYRSALEMLQEHRPSAVAVEQLYSHYERPRTAILMGHARGALFLAAAECGAPVASYLPTRVKKTVTGAGHASKSQIQRAIQVEFGLARPPDPPDVADAIAVALCHALALRKRAG